LSYQYRKNRFQDKFKLFFKSAILNASI